jgi:hypothetical protein
VSAREGLARRHPRQAGRRGRGARELRGVAGNARGLGPLSQLQLQQPAAHLPAVPPGDARRRLPRLAAPGAPGEEGRAGPRHTGCRRVAPVERDDQEHDEKIEILTGFRVVHVFDVCQTDGEELPEVAPRRLEGEVPAGINQALEQRVADAGFALKREAIAQHSCNGYADFERRVVVLRDDICGIQATKTLIHELAHVLLHAEADLSERSLPEVEAESVAFVVASFLGLDTSDYSFAYVARWAAGDAELVAATRSGSPPPPGPSSSRSSNKPATSAHGSDERWCRRCSFESAGRLRTEVDPQGPGHWSPPCGSPTTAKY